MLRFSRFTVLTAAVVLLAACGDDENTGASCEVADDCFPDVDHEDLSGEVECIDRVPDGYCTHLCAVDEDCCAVEGECQTDNAQVCAPFENTTVTRCFLSCEPEVIGDMEENDYCHEFAHEDFNCRSTGGGNENRKVCVPNE
jgi:hypothetical protein